jgi:hypothetical protein
VSAKIKYARVAAAHEGIAEMIVSIEYENGGVTDISLDSAAVDALMTSTKATSLDALIGISWEQVRDALTVAYNRF